MVARPWAKGKETLVAEFPDLPDGTSPTQGTLGLSASPLADD
jgi:hypothetical protein